MQLDKSPNKPASRNGAAGFLGVMNMNDKLLINALEFQRDQAPKIQTILHGLEQCPKRNSSLEIRIAIEFARGEDLAKMVEFTHGNFKAKVVNVFECWDLMIRKFKTANTKSHLALNYKNRELPENQRGRSGYFSHHPTIKFTSNRYKLAKLSPQEEALNGLI